MRVSGGFALSPRTKRLIVVSSSGLFTAGSLAAGFTNGVERWLWLGVDTACALVTVGGVFSPGADAGAAASGGGSGGVPTVFMVGGGPAKPYPVWEPELKRLGRQLATAGSVPQRLGGPALAAVYGTPDSETSEFARHLGVRLAHDYQYPLVFRLDASSHDSLVASIDLLGDWLGVEAVERIGVRTRRVWARVQQYAKSMLIYDGVRLFDDVLAFLPQCTAAQVLMTSEEPGFPDEAPDDVRLLRIEPAPEAGESALARVSGDLDAASLFALIACLAPSRLPYEVFTGPESARAVGEPWESLLGSESRLRRALRRLAEARVVFEEPDGAAVRVFGRARQAWWLREQDGVDQTRSLAAAAAFRLIAAAFPQQPGEPASWPLCTALLDHARAVLALAGQTIPQVPQIPQLPQTSRDDSSRDRQGVGGQDDGHDAPCPCVFVLGPTELVDAARLLLRTGTYRHRRDQLDAARADLLCGSELLGAEPTGPGPRELAADLLDQRAEVEFHAARLDEACALAQRAVELREADTPGLAASLTVLHLVLREQGRLVEALAAIRRALDILERTFGDRSRQAGQAIYYEARVLWRQGHYAQAEARAEQAVRVQTAACGAEHPDVGVTLTALGMIRRDQNDLVAAEAALRRAVRILSGAHGPMAQESTLKAKEYLAGVLAARGGFDEAEPLVEAVLRARTEDLGPDHPNAAMARVIRSRTRLGRGDARGALEDGREAERVYAASSGPEHPYVALALVEQARALWSLRDVDGAEEVRRRAVQIRERALGLEHPLTVEARNLPE